MIAAAVIFFLCVLISAAYVMLKVHSAYEAKIVVIPSQHVSLTVNGTAIDLDMSTPDKWYDIPMMTTERDTEIKVGDFQGYDMTIGGKHASAASTVKIRLEKLEEGGSIPIVLKSQGSSVETKFYIAAKNSSFPAISTLGKGIGKGYYYSAFKDFIFKMDCSGNLVFYKYVPGGFDFKMTKVDGKTRYSYFEATTSLQNSLSTGAGVHKAVIMDQNYNVVDEIPFMQPKGNTPEDYPLDAHDMTILGDQHYLIESSVGERATNIPADVPHSAFGARVYATVIQEVDHGKLLWQWDSTEHPELYGISVESNDYFNTKQQWADYMHFNSMTVDPSDQNLICSFRSLDTVLKIDRKTGNILWMLGGKGDQFGLTKDQKSSRQHFARLTEDGFLTIFDNGTNTVMSPYPKQYEGSGKGITRILKLKLDQINKKLISYQAFTLDQQYSAYMGSATEIIPDSDTFLVGWGGRTTQNALFSLIDFANHKVLFEAVAPIDCSSYRAYWFAE